MAKEQIIVALDIGSFKISCVVATLSASKLSIIGVHNHPSKGIKNGVVNNIDGAVNAISETLNKTEMISGHPISRVIATVNGTHIESLNSHGVVAVSGQDSEISVEDVARVNEAAQAISLPSSREIIHVLPREYIVDKQKGIFDPVGMTGVRLEVEANIIHGSTTSIKNLTKCIQQVGVDVDRYIYTGLASAEAVLTDTEKELGTMVIDIGGGTMSLIIYTKGRPAYSAVLPIGGQDITNDLAIGLRTSLEDAEKIKIKLSTEKELSDRNVYLSKDGKEAKIPKGELYVGDMNVQMETVPKNMLNDIIYNRIEEAFKFANIYVKKSGFEGKLPAGVVVTGGASQIGGIEQVGENVFNLSVRVGRPTGISGLIEQVNNPQSASVVGALKLIANSMKEETRTSVYKSGNIMGVKNKVVNFIKSFLP